MHHRPNLNFAIVNMDNKRKSCGQPTTSTKKAKISSYLTNLPRDVVFNILLRLRVKDICSFSAVSRDCRACVSDPAFRKYHHQQSKQNPRVLVTAITKNSDDSLQFYSFDPYTSHILKLPLTLEYCMGFRCSYELVCACKLCMSDIETEQRIWVCNPSNGHVLQLPNNYDQEDEIGSCDCERILYSVYFGYVNLTKEYKVLQCVFHNGTGSCAVFMWEVFTLRASYNDGRLSAVGDGWREVCRPPFELNESISASVDVDGSICILPDETSDYATSRIARFDLVHEEWCSLPLPAADSIARRYRWSVRLVEMRGKLCLADCGQSYGKPMEIWMLSDFDGGDWVKQYSIDLSFLGHQYNIALAGAKGAMRDGGLLVEFTGMNAVSSYDPEGKMFQDFEIEEKLSLEEGEVEHCTACLYSESFLKLEV